MPGGLKLAPLMTEIKVDLDNFKENLDDAAKIGKDGAEKISNEMSYVTKVGEKLTTVGNAMTKYVTTPIVGAGTASVKMAIDFEDSMAKVSTIADTSKVTIDELKAGILELSGKTGESASELNEALYQAISASVDTADAVDFLHVATMAAVGGFTDTTTAVNGLTTVLNSYGKEASEAEEIANQMLVTQNLGKTSFGELASSMGQVTPVAASLGVATEELLSSLAVTTAQGLGTSESITALKGAMSNIIKPTTEASKAAEALGIDFSVSALQSKGWIGFLGDLRSQLQKAAPEYAELSDKVASGTSRLEAMEKAGKKNTDEYKKLKKEVSESTKQMEAIAQASDSTIGGFATMFGSVEGLNSVLMLTSEQGMEKYNESMKEMSTNTTALRDAYDKMDSAPGRQMQKALNDIKNAGIEMGDKLLPTVNKAVQEIRKLVSRFSELSDEEKENIIQWAGVAAAAGPALKVLGGGITTVTKLSSVIGGASKAIGAVGKSSGLIGGMAGLTSMMAPVAIGAGAVGMGIYAIHENAEFMNSTVLKSTDEMSWLEKILSKTGSTTRYSTEELENMGYVHKDFSENISPEFQDAVKKSAEDVHNLSVFMHEIGFDGVITEEESSEFNSRVEAACNEAIKIIQEKKQEINGGLTELFGMDDGVIDEGEQQLLDYLNRTYDTSIEEITKLKADIYAIKEKAVEEGRELNEQEIADVEYKMSEIRRIELESMTANEEEMLYAKNEFLQRARNMDLEETSSLLQEKAKLRDEEIIKINASYDTQIDMLKSKLSDMYGAERANAIKQIKDLEADKKIKVSQQQELYEEYMNIIRENNPKMLEEISEYNGQILTEADKTSQELLQELKTRYEGLSDITESGCYTVYNTVTGSNEDIAVIYNEVTGEIIGLYSYATSEVGGYNKQLAKDTQKMALNHKGSFDLIGDSLATYVTQSGAVVNAGGVIVGSLKDIKENADGTRTGITELNGTPVEIQVNKDGTILALQEINATADNAARPRILTITTKTYQASGYEQAMLHTGATTRHFNGLNYVPYDGYTAVLHKGERVLSAKENEQYNNSPGISAEEISRIIDRKMNSFVMVLNDREVGRIVRRHKG